MIIETNNSHIESYGDIKEYKTSIDPKNLDFITTLLSSNLYSNPEQSFLREIVSNAWDSQVEAGTTDTPILIDIDGSKNKITIRDYGTGISPERFSEIYCNIGSSTKRESNKFIGGFGIGKFASLACSDTVYINSYYNGTVYQYIMIKQGNSITTNLVLQKPTDEKNGVEISINVKSLLRFFTGLKYLIYFPNIYVNCTGGYKSQADYINYSKIKYYNNFAVNSVQSNGILLGYVLYPLDTSKIDYALYSKFRYIYCYGLVLKFNIGDLEITPNRENIIYTEQTIKAINAKIEAAYNEIIEIGKNTFTNKFDSLYDIIKYYNKSVSLPLLNGCDDFKLLFNHLYTEIYYKDKLLSSKEIRDITLLLSARVPSSLVRYEIRFKNIYKGPYFDWTGCSLLYIENYVKLKMELRDFLAENYSKYIVLSRIPTKEELYNSFKDKIDSDSINEVYSNFIKNITILDILKDETYLKYVENYKKPEYKKKEKTENIILYTYRISTYNNYGYWNTSTYTYDKLVEHLKSLKKGFILVPYKDAPNIGNAMGYCNYNYYKIEKKIYDKLEKEFFSNRISYDKFINSKKVSLLYTIKNTKLNYYLNNNIIRYMPENKQALLFMIKDVPSVSIEYKNVKEDEEVKAALKDYDNFAQKFEEIEKLRDSLFLHSNMVSFLFLRDKIRISKEMYLNLKESKLYKMLCRK